MGSTATPDQLTPQQARNRLGSVRRHHPDDKSRETEARRDLAAAKLAAYIERVVDTAPPLTPEQRDRLAVLIRGGGTG